jgi:hypothetical protein
MRALTYIEIDVPTFDPESPEQIETFRFTYDCNYSPPEIDAIPSLEDVNYSPSTLSLGKDLGTRAQLSLTFSDHRHIFAGEPFTQGTFWGKWRARYGQRLQSRPLRWIQGLEGQDFDDFEVRHFVIESTNGPMPNGGGYTIIAQDILKFADGDRAQAPLSSNGFMVAGIDEDDLAFTLSPSGIGNNEYATSGYLALAGKEIVSFTRSGDAITIVARAQLGTEAASHDAGSRVQTVLRYVGEDPADILRDLLVDYAGVDPAYIPLTTWQNETATYLQQQYSANIADPIDVSKLVSELIEQAALAMWWEPAEQLIKLQVLRGIPTTAAVFDEDNTVEGSLTITEQPTTRLTQVLVYFGQRDPLAPIDEERNFRSAVLVVDGDAELDYGVTMLKKIYSRWIPFGARTVADRLGTLILSRFRDPPRKFTFNLFRWQDLTPTLGGGFRMRSWAIQDETGLVSDAPIQVTRQNPLSDRYEVTAEEMLYQALNPGDLTNRAITIDSAINNVNLRDIHDTIYPDPTGSESPAITVTCTIETAVIVGSDNTGLPAFDVGAWPVGVTVNLVVLGDIRGAGGAGGSGSTSGSPGGPGGTALYTRFAIGLTDAAGRIFGGGGGGGYARFQVASPPFSDLRAGGGGGAGQIPGLAGTASGGSSPTPGAPGTLDAGGAGGDVGSAHAGDGGGPGLAGGSGNGGGGQPGGAAGNAVDGISFVTQIGAAGDRRGGEIN